MRAAALIVALLLGGCGPHPSDARAGAHFLRDRAELEKLRDALVADPRLDLISIDRSGDNYGYRELASEHGCTPKDSPAVDGCWRSVSSPPFPAWRDWRDRLARLGVASMVRTTDGVSFTLSISATSMTTGSTLSLVARKSAPPSLVADTRSARAAPTGDHRARLDDGWYLHFHWDGAYAPKAPIS